MISIEHIAHYINIKTIAVQTAESELSALKTTKILNHAHFDPNQY